MGAVIAAADGDGTRTKVDVGCVECGKPRGVGQGGGV